jgi:hypothetical protein
MNIILEKYVRVCFLQPILTQSNSEVTTCPCAYAFPIIYWSCSDSVVYLGIHFINQIINHQDLLETCYALFNVLG